MTIHRRSGFTLIEVLMFTAFVSILMTGATFLMASALTVRSHVRAAHILEENLRFAMNRIRSLEESGSGVLMPSISTTGAALTLVMPTAAENPTTINLADGTLFLTQGSVPAAALTSREILISNLTFLHVSSTPPMVRTVLTAGLRNATVSFPSMTVTSTGSLRR